MVLTVLLCHFVTHQSNILDYIGSNYFIIQASGLPIYWHNFDSLQQEKGEGGGLGFQIELSFDSAP